MYSDAYYDPPSPVREWEDFHFCFTCDADTNQLFAVWSPGRYCTRECELCGDVVEHEDEDE